MEEKSSSNGGLRHRPDPPREEEEIEEGEIHRGGGFYDSGSKTEDDDDRYVFQSRRDDDEEEERMHPTCKRRSLEDILAENSGALPLPSPTPSSGSEGTISDHVDGIGACSTPVAREAFPCHVARTNPEPIHDGPSAVMVAEANPPNQVVDNHHLPAAAAYVGAHHRAPPQPAAPVQPLALLPEAAQGGPYRCKIAQGGSGGVLAAKPEGKHPCQVCGQEFLTGVALGGHRRKHYVGKVIVNKKKHGEPAPVPAPPPTGVWINVVRIFSFDMEKPADADEQDGGSD